MGVLSAKARRRLIRAAACVLVIGTIAGAAMLARAYLRAVRAETVNSWRMRLESAIEGRVAGVSFWAEARLRDAQLVANYPSMRALLAAHRAGTAANPHAGHVTELLEALIRYQPIRAAYAVDPDGVVVARAGAGTATGQALAGGVRHLAARRATTGGRVDSEGRWSGDLITLPNHGDGAAVLFTSWVPTGPADPPLGAIVFEEDPAEYLFGHLARGFLASRTAEIVLLVPRRSTISVVDPEPSGKLATGEGRSPVGRPLAVLAAAPDLTFQEDVDDAGVPVLAMTHPIPGTAWVLLATVHRDEAVAPAMRQALQGIAAASGIFLAILGAGFGLWRNRQAAYMRERMQLEERLKQSQKMEAIGRLAGGVAHDFNNLLTVISGYAEMARDGGGDKRRRSYLDEILQASDRATALTRQLLAFGRKQVLQPRSIDVNEVVKDIERMLRRLIGEDITLDIQLSDGPVRTHADPGQLGQVLVNLAVNARDAMPQGGRVEISTDIVNVGSIWEGEPPDGLAPGRYVQITVRDTGVGMTPEVQAKVFEPFFTTKPSGRGTGLGLSTVYGIVKQSGGSITVESRPRQGTTFQVLLPAIAPEEVQASPAAGVSVHAAAPPEPVVAVGEASLRVAAAPQPGAAGRETVLVMEDSEPVRSLVQSALEGAGYTVLVAADAEEGQRILSEHHGHVQLLLADVVLPGRNGREFARDATAGRPGLRVLYMSGYPLGAVGTSGELQPGVAFLEKPFTPATVAARVREILDRPAAEARA